MIRPRRRFPVGQSRNYHAARAVVTRHTSHTVGKGRWERQTHQSIVFRFVSKSCCRFGIERSSGNMSAGADSSHSNHLPQHEIEMGFPKLGVRDQFPIGTNVEVYFSLIGDAPRTLHFHGVRTQRRTVPSREEQLQGT